MGTLKLTPDPRFHATVLVPVPGGEPAPVQFRFRHRTREQLAAFVRSADERDDVANILEMADGWDLSDAFDRDNVQRLVDNYIGSPKEVFDTYLRELTKGRAGN